MSMKLVELISVGNEVLDGRVINTNHHSISEQLQQHGFELTYTVTCDDTHHSIITSIQIALQRSRVCIITGGLGPTNDDNTLQALADATGVSLVHSDERFQHIQSIYERKKKPMPKSNKKQALIPENAQSITNPVGTAMVYVVFRIKFFCC